MNNLVEYNIDWEYWLTVSLIIIGSVVTSKLVRKLLGLAINRQSKKVNVDPTNFSFLKNSIAFIIYTAGIIIIFNITPSLKNVSRALFASAGIFAAVVGFASQKAFSNIIGGVFILIFRPFRVQDIIEVGSLNKGRVEEITLRHTIIRNYENRRIIIPNSVISEETIINSSLIDSKIKKFVEYGISYESNVDLAKQILFEEAIKHPNVIDNRTQQEKEENRPVVQVRVLNLGDFSITLRAYVWTKDNDDAFDLYCDLNESVKKRFDAEGIEIPYPHRTIVYKNNNAKETTSDVD